MTATQEQFDEDIQSFYTSADEEARLTKTVGSRVEFLRVQSILRTLLSPASAVIDVGGATGIHSTWLAADGHTVTLVDPVPSQVEAARQHGTFTAMVGDARQLDIQDNSADATLLFGPLYHLMDMEDRVRAFAEASRVTKPGGFVVAAGVSRHSVCLFMHSYGEFLANQQNSASTSNEENTTEALLDATHLIRPTAGGHVSVGSGVVELLELGTVPRLGEGFPCAHCHTTDELRHEARSAGLDVCATYGVEGPSEAALEQLELPEHEGLVDAAMKIAEAFDGENVSDAIKDRSAHILIVAKVPS